MDLAGSTRQLGVSRSLLTIKIALRPRYLKPSLTVTLPSPLIDLGP